MPSCAAAGLSKPGHGLYYALLKIGALVEPVSQAAAHLSRTAQRFLEYVTSDPELMRPLHHLAAGDYFASLQSWPTFVDGEKLAEIRRATVGLTRLVKSIPERIFGNDAGKIAAYYGLHNEALIALLRHPPTGLDGVLVRNDFVDTPDGLKCLEVNAGMIGGWQLRYFEQRVLAHPVIARFLKGEGVTPHYRDPLAVMMQFIIDQNLGKPIAASGVLNLAITMNKRTPPPGEDARLSRMYRGMLDATGTGLTGEVVLCSCADLSRRQGQIWHRDRRPIQALVQMSDEDLPGVVFQTFKAGRLSLYNGPISALLNQKQTLALLSERVDSAELTADERDLLRRHLPWTRAAGPGAATFRGETRALPDLLIAHREELVLKPALGYQGRGVAFGHLTPPDAWARLVAEAVAQGGWLVQERADSRPYVYQ